MTKRFVVKKFIIAETMSEALELELQTKPEEIFVDVDWTPPAAAGAGFKTA